MNYHYKKNANYIRNITYGSKSVCKINITYGYNPYVTFGAMEREGLHTDFSVCKFWHQNIKCAMNGIQSQVHSNNSTKI